MENLLVEVVASQVLSNHRVLLGTYCREPVSTVASVGDIREGSLHGRRRCWNRQHHARQRCENFHRLILRRVLLPPGQHVLLSVHRIGLEPAGQFAELLLDVFSKPNFVLNVLGVQYNPILYVKTNLKSDRTGAYISFGRIRIDVVWNVTLRRLVRHQKICILRQTTRLLEKT
jgi:hypothetical protein